MAQKKKRKWDSISRKRADEVEQEEVRRAEVACCLLRPVGKKPYYLLRGTDCIALNNLAEFHADSICSWRTKRSGSHRGLNIWAIPKLRIRSEQHRLSSR